MQKQDQEAVALIRVRSDDLRKMCAVIGLKLPGKTQAEAAAAAAAAAAVRQSGLTKKHGHPVHGRAWTSRWRILLKKVQPDVDLHQHRFIHENMRGQPSHNL